MIDNSAYYGLTNPAFTQDIAGSMIGVMYPTTIDAINPTGDLLPVEVNATLNPGQPLQDAYQNKESNEKKTLTRDKEENVIKNIAYAIGALGLGTLGFLKFKAPVTKAFSSFASGLTTSISTGFAKVKTGAKTVFDSVKSFTTGLISKIKK